MIAKAKTPRAAPCFLLTPCLAKAGLTLLYTNSQKTGGTILRQAASLFAGKPGPDQDAG
jgi:hypothetical protein